MGTRQVGPYCPDCGEKTVVLRSLKKGGDYCPCGWSEKDDVWREEIKKRSGDLVERDG